MSKMALHGPFGHPQHKLCAKERQGVKLAGGVRHTVGKLSRRATSLLKPHPNRRFEQRVMSCQSPGSLNRDNLGTVSGLSLGSPGTKSHLDVAPMEWRRIYYMGEGGGFPRVRAVVSQISPKLPVACLNTKGAPECELTNLLVGLMQV
jgi:hypothetical protein